MFGLDFASAMSEVAGQTGGVPDAIGQQLGTVKLGITASMAMEPARFAGPCFSRRERIFCAPAP